MKARAWLPSQASEREAAILTAHAGASTDALRSAIDRLVDRNREIHERECLNLNPATNVMSPRAEAALARGLGARPSLGHAGNKYEVGLEAIEEIEVLTAELACRVFAADHAELRPLSGAMANLMAFMATCSPGDDIIVPPPSIGGHVTHNTAGAAGLYGLNVHEAPIDPERYTVDIDGVRALAASVQPRLITIGSSLNLEPHPVAELRSIADDVGATLMFDAAHLCGMFAGRAWPNPLSQGAHLMTLSTYKSLAGPAGGLIVTDDAGLAERLDAIGYPGMTANFDAGRITALAITLLDWIDHGVAYAEAMVSTAAALADALIERDVDVFRTTRGPTISHQFAIRSDDPDAAVTRLRAANLLTCAIGLPDGGGVRIGTPEIARWGFTDDHMPALAAIIADALSHGTDAAHLASLAGAVTEFRAPFDRVHFCS